MTHETFELITFITNRGFEVHFNEKEVIVFVNIAWIEEFTETIHVIAPNIFNEGLTCNIKRNVVAIEIDDIIEKIGSDTKEFKFELEKWRRIKNAK